MDELRRFDLNLLVAFAVMMEERNVSRAARRLSLGQPAMSQALARLRASFGDRLFIRSGGTMAPTPRALALAAPVGAILADLRQKVLATRPFDPATAQHIFRVGVSDYSEIVVMRPVLRRLLKEAPRMRIVLQHTDRDRVGAMLEAGVVDLAIGFYPDVPGKLQSETLFHEDFACVFDAAACGLQPPIGLAAYLSLPHVMMSLRGEFEGHIDATLKRARRTRFVFATTPHFLAIPPLLHGAAAVAALPRRLAEHCAEIAGLAISELPVESEGYDVGMVWHARTEHDLPQRWFRDCVRRERGDAGASGKSRPVRLRK